MTLYEMMFSVGEKAYRDGTYENVIKTQDFLLLPKNLQIAFWDGAAAAQKSLDFKRQSSLDTDEIVYITKRN